MKKILVLGNLYKPELNKFIKLDSNYLIKIDGDDQFELNDINNLLNFAKSNRTI